MDVRVSILDFQMAWRAVDEALRAGRGAFERTAVAFSVRRAVVMAAVDRLEAAFGGTPFFEARIRRSGSLTPMGAVFQQMAPRVIEAWETILVEEKGLEGRLSEVRAGPARLKAPATRPTAKTEELVTALDRQAERIEDALALIEASPPHARQDGAALAGTKAADAMKAVLAILTEAGANGVNSRELGAAVTAAGIRSGAAETAKSVLRGAGLVHCKGRRWFVTGHE